MRKVIFFALMIGLGLAGFYWLEPQPTADILSSVNSMATAIIGWFDD